MDRRTFIKHSGLFLLTSYALPSALLRTFAAETLPKTVPILGRRPKVLVVVFQRGAVDGLSMVAPIGDPAYGAKIRPSIALPTSGDGAALPLNGFFSFHPSLKSLQKFWLSGQLAVIHAVGSPNTTRSHFDAQDYLESGTPGVKATADGFLNRATAQLAPLPNHSNTLRTIAMQPSLPRIVRGSSGAFAMASLKELAQAQMFKGGVGENFESMYDSALDQALRGAGQQSFDAAKVLKQVESQRSKVNYPSGPLGKRLSDIAALVRGDVGMRVAVTDIGGWDTHQRQGGADGQLSKRLKEFSDTLAAFADDLGPLMDDVCLVTMTEFGRTVKENGNGGTDHGHGSVMLVLGNHLKPKQVHARWSSLAEPNLFEGRDLPVTTDFREVWRELLTQHLGVKDLKTVFPGFTFPSQKLNLFT